jgi:O-antigen/teichoic acid export membrane protein
MFASIRRLLKHSAVYGMGHVLSRAVSFLLTPFLTHTITPEQYGAYTLLYAFSSIALVVFIYGADIAFLRFYIPEKDPERRQDIFSTVLWSSLITSGVLFALIILFRNALAGLIFDNPDNLGVSAGYLLILNAGILFADTLCTYPYLWLRSVEKSMPFMLLKMSGAVVHVGLTVLFLTVFHRGINGIFEANLIASIYQLALLLPVILKNTRFVLILSSFGEFFKFGLPNMPSQIFVMMVEISDRKVLEIIAGLSVVGIYSAGYRLGLLMSVIVMGFRFAWQPFFMSISDRSDARETYARIFTYFMLVTGTLFLLLVFVVTPLLKIPLPFVGTLIEKRYWEGLRVFPVVLLAQICNGAYANFMVGVYLQKKTGLMPLVTGAAAVVNVAGNFLLIPIFGMMAAAWTTFLSYFTLAALLYFLIQRHYYIKYEWKRIGIIVGCGGFVYLLSVVPFLQDHWPWKLLLIPLFFMALKTTKFFLPEELAAVRRRFSFSRAH